MRTFLELKGITKTYPGVVALDDVSIKIEQGRIHVLMGENGAGKSTLIKTISGAEKPDCGVICIEGKDYAQLTPAQAVSLGIGIIYQELNLVPSLSVVENVFLGARVGGTLGPDYGEMRRRANTLFEELGVCIDVDQMVGTLSVAKQQLVEIAKAISRDAKLLIMDEPTSSIAQADVENLIKIIFRLKEKGVTIIYISHRMEEIFRLADTITVLRDGKHIATKPASEYTRKDLVKLMVGRELSESYPKRTVVPSKVLMELNGVCGNGDTDISFTVRRSEILGIAGLVGAGRTELAKMLYGVAKVDSGKIYIDGKAVNIRSAQQAISCGIGLIPEDRKREGGFLEYPILWNISIMSLRRISRFSVISRKDEEKLSNHYANLFKIKTPSYQQLLKNLSGGNQQKVILAKTLAAQTRIIIFDEPTRGIDVGAKQEIYHLMNELVAQGISIIMISSEMEELMGMSDRIVVMHEGHMTGILDKHDFDQSRIMELASGL